MNKRLNALIAAAILIAAAAPATAKQPDDDTGTIALVASINSQPAMRPVYWYVDGLLVTTNHSSNYKASPATHVVRARIGDTSYTRNVAVIAGQTTMALFDMTEAAQIEDAKK